MSKTLVGGTSPDKKGKQKKISGRLPNPDRFGNYWLASREDGSPDTKEGPAIFPSKKLVGERDDGKVVDNGNFILFGGKVRGFIFDGADYLRFDTPDEAFDELKRLGLVEEQNV